MYWYVGAVDVSVVATRNGCCRGGVVIGSNVFGNSLSICFPKEEMMSPLFIKKNCGVLAGVPFICSVPLVSATQCKFTSH